MNKYLILLLMQIFLWQFCYGQESSHDSLFNKFRRDIQIELEEHEGCVNWDNYTCESYYTLMSIHPIDTLLKYTDDIIPTVRSSIFVGIALKNAEEKILREILNKHKDDTAKFSSCAYDVHTTRSVREEMQFTLNLKAENKLDTADYKARLEEVKKNIHVIITGANHGLISKFSLLKVDSLFCSDENFRIISFTVILRNKEYRTNNIITEQIKCVIRKMEPNERISFGEIAAEIPDKSIRKLAPFSLKIIR